MVDGHLWMGSPIWKINGHMDDRLVVDDGVLWFGVDFVMLDRNG